MGLEDIQLDFIIYFVEGLMMMLCNIVVAGAVIKYKSLRERKEYTIVAGLAIADAINGYCYMWAGLWRNYKLYTNTSTEIYTPFQCLWTGAGYNAFWIIVDPLSKGMLLIISVDRLVAISLPLVYYRLTRKYTLLLCLGMYAPCTVLGVVGWVLSYIESQQPDNLVEAICYSEYAVLNLDFAWLSYTLMSWFAILSIAVYALVIAVQIIRTRAKLNLADKGKELTKQEEKKRKDEMARQRRLMTTLGINNGLMFLLVVIPSQVSSYLVSLEMDADQLNAFVIPLMIIQNVNPILNVFLYSLRHKDLRRAISSFILCRQKVPKTETSVSQTKE